MSRDVLDLSNRRTANPGASCAARGCAGLCTERGLVAAYRAYRRRMLGRARLVVVDVDLAEEAVQEAFVRAWRSCASFDPAGGPLLNWLLVITRNVAIDMVKARSRRPQLAPAVDDAAAERPSVGASIGLSDTDRVLLRDQLSGALARIGTDHRIVVVETILRDRPYADVAAELGVPAGTVRSRVHYALRHLRALLEDEGEGEAA